ncbi:MAG TPA: nuclear transport factor 2 family protein [Solirubrobacterales bacterium]|nr:nuclear transport factor 2 family protein [Solirubrobacterales bacterium]
MSAAEPSCEKTALDFAGRWVDRWNAHDIEGILALVSDDILWQDPSLESPARGHVEAREYVASLFRAFPDISWSMPSGVCVSSVEGHGDGILRVAQPWACRGTALGQIDPPGFAPTGKAFELEGVDLWEMCLPEKRLRQVVSHYDALEFARRIELMPSRGSKGERAMVRLQRLKERLRR